MIRSKNPTKLQARRVSLHGTLAEKYHRNARTKRTARKRASQNRVAVNRNRRRRSSGRVDQRTPSNYSENDKTR